MKKCRSRNENLCIFRQRGPLHFSVGPKNKKRKKSKQDENEFSVDSKIGRFPFARETLSCPNECKYSYGRNQVNSKTIDVIIERELKDTETQSQSTDINKRYFSKYHQCTDFCHFFFFFIFWLDIKLLLLFIYGCVIFVCPGASNRLSFNFNHVIFCMIGISHSLGNEYILFFTFTIKPVLNDNFDY